MLQCEICGKEYETSQELSDHLTSHHGIAGGDSQPVTEPDANQQFQDILNEPERINIELNVMNEKLKIANKASHDYAEIFASFCEDVLVPLLEKSVEDSINMHRLSSLIDKMSKITTGGLTNYLEKQMEYRRNALIEVKKVAKSARISTELFKKQSNNF